MRKPLKLTFRGLIKMKKEKSRGLPNNGGSKRFGTVSVRTWKVAPPLFRPYTPQALAIQQRYVADRVKKRLGLQVEEALLGPLLPKSLCQIAAAAEVEWMIKTAALWDRQLRAEDRFFCRRYAVTVTHPRCRVPLNQLGPDKISQVKRRIQRQHRRRLPFESYGVGAVEVGFDVESDGHAIAHPHAHFVLWVIAADSMAARRAIRKAFAPVGVDAAPRSVFVQQVEDLDGWIEYATKGLFLRGLSQRSCFCDEDAHHQTVDQRPSKAVETAFLKLVLRLQRPSDRTLLIGFRRKGSELCRSARRPPPASVVTEPVASD